jgi:hypothetical protein
MVPFIRGFHFLSLDSIPLMIFGEVPEEDPLHDIPFLFTAQMSFMECGKSHVRGRR